MLVATFGPTTGWVGKTITFENDTFVLQDHGPISASDVMQYDKQGHLVWANEQARALVEAKAQGAVAPAPIAPVAMVERSSPPTSQPAPSGAKTKKTKKKMTVRRRLMFSLLAFVVIVVVVVAVAVAASGPKTTPAQQARDYITSHEGDALIVQHAVFNVQADVHALTLLKTQAAVNTLAQDAQQAHDTLNSLRGAFALNTTTSGALGNDETEVFGAVNDLKNAMGAAVAFTGNPNAATLAQFSEVAGRIRTAR
jgi:hypothetical protein